MSADFKSSADLLISLTPKNLHDIRNSLNTILGYSEILQDESFALDEQNKIALSMEKAALNIKSLLGVKKEEIVEVEKKIPSSGTAIEAFVDAAVQSDTQKILIIDDNLENLSLFKTILNPYGYAIKLASSGEEALGIMQNFYPELILLDIVMPQMDGYEVLKELKKNRLTCDIPVIFLTANDKTDDIVKGFEKGAVDYIAKPFHPRELIARVHTHLQKAKLLANLKRLMEHSFHELYTPLSVVSSAMQMQELEYKQTNYTQMTLAACKTLQNIYDDLHYSINYANRQKQITELDFSALLSQRINYFELVASSRFLRFKTDLPTQMLLRFNQEDMERVIDNLISNALKYTKEDEDISISLTQNGGKWIFSICNPVFKEVDVKKIFQKYYRNNEEVFGLGLGLELVASICKENNIAISAVCGGGEFCINMELI